MTTPPMWRTQQTALDLIYEHPGTYLAHDMGTGKSRIVCEYIRSVTPKRVLIFCPKAVIGVWARELIKWGVDGYHIMADDRANGQRRADMISEDVNAAALSITVLNYEAITSRYVKHVLPSVKWDLIVCDEAHRIKQWDGKFSRFIRERLRAAKRIALSGTPTPYNILDWWSQIAFLDTRVLDRSFYGFRARYCVMGGHHVNGKPVEVVGFCNQEDLKKRLAAVVHRVTLDEVVELPEVRHEWRMVTLDTTTQRIYDSMAETLEAQIDGGVITAANVMVRTTKLSQITSGFMINEHNVAKSFGDEKTGHLMEILGDTMSEPLVVFARFRHDLDVASTLAHRLGRRVYEVRGGVVDISGKWEPERRAGDQGEPVAVIQYQAGGLGIDLTAARYAVNYSWMWESAVMAQAFARLHRAGQSRRCVFIHLVAPNTIDVVLPKVVGKRIDVQREMLEHFKTTKQETHV